MSARLLLPALALLALTGCTGGPAPEHAVHDNAGTEVRTESGASDAAARYVQLLSSAAMYDSASRESVLRDAVHPDGRDQVPQLLAAYQRVAGVLDLGPDGQPERGSLVARAAVAGTRVTRWTPDEARVEVWVVGLLGVAAHASPHPVQERWSTETVDVRWDGSAWRWLALRSADGPVPVAGAQLPSPQEALTDLPPAPVAR